MQRLFAAEGPWPTPWMERVLPKVVKLAEHAPARTVFTRFLTPRSPEEMPGMWKEYYRKWQNVTRERIDPKMLDLMPVLERFAPPAQVFDKFVYSAFATGELHQMLRARNVDTLIYQWIRDRRVRGLHRVVSPRYRVPGNRCAGCDLQLVRRKSRRALSLSRNGSPCRSPSRRSMTSSIAGGSEHCPPKFRARC